MKHEELLLSAMDGVKEEFLMEAYEYKREKAVIRKRGILIAAAAAAALAITAGAVTLSMREAADVSAREVKEDGPSEYRDEGSITTGLGALLKNIKLN